MKKKFLSSIILFSLVTVAAMAGERDKDIDRFGRYKDDKVTSGGFTLSSDCYGMFIQNVQGFRSHPGLGVSLGGFVDFKVIPKLVIEMGLQLNREVTAIENETSSGSMKNYAVRIPVYVMGKFDLGSKGIWYFGGGPYSEFVVNNTTTLGGGKFNPYEQVVGTDSDGGDVFALSNHNAGVGLKLAYEFPFHMQLYLSGGSSISDILGYSHGKGYIRPYQASVGIAYRFR